MRRVQIPDETVDMLRRKSIYVAKFSHYATLTASISTREIHPLGGYLTAVVAHLTTASTAGAVELSIMKNSVEVGVLSIPVEEHFGIVEFDEDVPMTALTDYIEIEITELGSGTANLSVFGLFS